MCRYSEILDRLSKSLFFLCMSEIVLKYNGIIIEVQILFMENTMSSLSAFVVGGT